tara:strand:- start:1279 stop:1425 length:147 start_codon:yes stop_codon:yes gene_type:complete
VPGLGDGHKLASSCGRLRNSTKIAAQFSGTQTVLAESFPQLLASLSVA